MIVPIDKIPIADVVIAYCSPAGTCNTRIRLIPTPTREVEAHMDIIRTFVRLGVTSMRCLMGKRIARNLSIVIARRFSNEKTDDKKKTIVVTPSSSQGFCPSAKSSAL